MHRELTTKLTNQNKAKYKLHHGNTAITKVDNCSFIFIPNYPFICLIVALLLLSQVVEVRKAGQPPFPIHPVSSEHQNVYWCRVGIHL